MNGTREKGLIQPKLPKHLEIAFGELYIAEIPGPASSLRINEYLRTVNLPANDEIPWCSAFVNWCMEKSGTLGTKSGMARSWIRWGRSITIPQLGCIVILWRDNPKGTAGHVGFYVGQQSSKIILLGGNQNDMVCIQSFPKSRVLGYRLPTR